MAIVTELVNVIGFQGSLKPLDKLTSGLQLAGKFSLGLTGLLASATISMIGFASTTLDSVDAVAQLSRETGIAVEEIQALGYAASVNGSSRQAAMTTISALTREIGDAALKGSSDFNRLGISVRDSNGNIKNAMQILEEVRGSLRRFSKAEQRSLSASLGIDKSFLQLLGKTSGQMALLKKRAQDLGVVTGKDAEATIEFNDSLTTLFFGVTSVQRQLAIGLAPEIKSLAEDFTTLLIENKSFIKDGVKETISWTKALTSPISSLITVIDGFISNTVGWKVALVTLGIAFLLFAAPITLTVAAIAAVIVIIDDLVTAFKGGKSLIAEFVKEWTGIDIKPIMEKMVKDFKNGVYRVRKLLGILKKEILGLKLAGAGEKASDKTLLSGSSGASFNANTFKLIQPKGNTAPNVQYIQDVTVTVPQAQPQTAAKIIGTTLSSEFKGAGQQARIGGR